jgi:hypothetical protein
LARSKIGGRQVGSAGAAGDELWHDRDVIVPGRQILRFPADAVGPNDGVAGVRVVAMMRVA